MVGEVLGKRYKILSKLGSGGMAEVYKAHCQILNRTVAIKVLRPQFTSNDEFVERFRREAQAAASLSHPNIVSIYDVGKDGDCYYIVMECVTGTSLKEAIAESGHMSPQRAARISWQILAALQHAHENGIVHRDIKPHNVMVTFDERVKVTDFGIARALSTSTLTETGTIIGTVNYFSPEQARGEAVEAQSDIYSLGVVLYEMLTGTVPFKGESPISIALQHLQTVVTPPTKLNPAIPKGLERVVLKALEKNPSRRYQDARQMMRALEPYAFPGNDYETFHDDVDSDSEITISDMPTQVISASDLAVNMEETLVRRKPNNKRNPRRTIFATLFFIFALLTLAAVVIIMLPEWLYVEEVRVPDFTGKTLEEAAALAEKAHVRLDDPDKRYDEAVLPNRVISQRPEPYARVKMNSKITLVVSLGKEIVEVPDLKGMDLRQALLELERLELNPGTQSREYSDEVEPNEIASQSPAAGVHAEKGTLVDIVLSDGPEPLLVTVQDFSGMNIADAESYLAVSGLVKGRITEEIREGVPAGIVISQTPEPGQLVMVGSAVDFVIGKSQDASSLLDAITPVSTLVTIVVPPGTDLQEVKIRINDYYGERDYYVGMHTPGERIEKQINAWGRKMRIRVYIGGVLYKDEMVPKG
jgi:serine/threonine-protein kinase